jgi:hypothetical protein
MLGSPELPLDFGPAAANPLDVIVMDWAEDIDLLEKLFYQQDTERNAGPDTKGE